ncbi:MarR family winged helix-turn-helix transcriptional regulator [Mycobacterium deserti]|uniref:MarR family winged helix-turn-helix transcriptional regulator n=1 Tax=Mycobacterium deserti TaxID=2978347 RepID=A0ABT2MHU3_9MYCO|nr:MarR family winged helix-turn-helix transcriptional regulator [Mycobacterium deserti]MCT7661848.1 MarR family winged helix-turn-helix transcriptional regulator [Mycobacterium deserti]
MTIPKDRMAAPVSSPSIVVLAVARQVENELNQALTDLGLTVTKLGLLGHIAGMPGVSFSELARMSGTTVQSVHTAVKALASAGLVQDRTARPGSSSTIVLTPRARRLLQAARDVVAEVDDRVFGKATDPLLRQIGTAIQSATADDVNK